MNQRVPLLFRPLFDRETAVHRLGEQETKVMPLAKTHTARLDQNPVLPGSQASVHPCPPLPRAPFQQALKGPTLGLDSTVRGREGRNDAFLIIQM